VSSGSFLRAEPTPELVASLGPLNQHIHAVVADLLQVVISRGEVDILSLRAVESAIASRLFLAIHRNELDLQNKLLHVLHSVIYAIFVHHSRPATASTTSLNSTTGEKVLSQGGRDIMFVRIISDAISIQRNSAVVHHWIDFLLMTIPQFQKSLNSIVFPLIDCLTVQLRSLVDEFKSTYDPTTSTLNPSTELPTSMITEATDSEFVALINALERLLLVATSESKIVIAEDTPRSPVVMSESATIASSGGGGFIGYMSGVLGSAETEPAYADQSKVTVFSVSAFDSVQ
jgi:hypothetical protein